MNKDHDLTKGNPFFLILTFSASLIVGNIFQQLYIVVDSIVVGKNIGSLGIDAIGGTEWLVFLVNGFIIGLVQGFSIILGNKYGEKNESSFLLYYKKAKVLCCVLSFVLVVSFIFSADLLLNLIGTKAEVFPYAKSYLIVIFIGIPFLIFYQFFAAVLRSRGNSHTHLVAMTVSSICNIVLDILFIIVFDMGIMGAALGTIVSEFIVMCICGYQLKKTFSTIDCSIPEKNEYKDIYIFKELILMGLPMALQSVITAVGGLVVINRINQFEIDFLTGYTVGNKIYGLLEIAASSYGLAIVSYVAQNLGASKYDRIHRGVRASIIIGLITSLCCSLVMLFLDIPIMKVFLSKDDISTGILSYGHRYLTIIALFFPFLYLLYIIRATLQGLGNTFVAMISSFAQLSMRVFFAVVLTKYIGSTAIYFGEISAWLFADFILASAYFLEAKNLNDVQVNSQEVE